MMTIVEDIFGRSEDPVTKKIILIRRFTFSNSKITVQVITLGATITSIKVPSARGGIADIVLGFDEIGAYLNTENNPYIGATIGRVANRIGNGTFPLNGKHITVSKNLSNKHTLHGGFQGFNNVLWTVTEKIPQQCSLKMQHVSPRRHEGFPGEVTATVHFQLTADNRFHIRYGATTTKSTPVNMTNHSYFNLAGHLSGKAGLFEHQIQIKADKFLSTDAEAIPTGEIRDVEDTTYDLREMTDLGPRIAQRAGRGYDDNFCVNLENNEVTMIAKAFHPKTGRWMEVETDQPGLQFYTGNFLPNPMKMELPIEGKEGAKYTKHAGFCFETQGYPDAVNHPHFPSIILDPGKEYVHNVIYKFGAGR